MTEFVKFSLGWLPRYGTGILQFTLSVLQCVAVCCSVLQCVAVDIEEGFDFSSSEHRRWRYDYRASVLHFLNKDDRVHDIQITEMIEFVQYV